MNARQIVCLVAAMSLAFLAQDAQAEEITRCDALPEPVAAKRDAIAAAAEAGDLEALAALTDPTHFTYSFGNGEGALSYWQRMRAEEGVDAAALIAGVLTAGCAQYDDGGNTLYFWPAAALIEYPDLTQEEIDALQALYEGALESWYVEGFEVGYYVGWRLYLEADGRWSSFVAGD